jgi:hypothetical protein
MVAGGRVGGPGLAAVLGGTSGRIGRVSACSVVVAGRITQGLVTRQ